MSNVALTWAWAQQVGDAGAKLVLVKIADQANDDGEAWPSRASLMDGCEAAETTIKRRLRLLRDAGFLTIEPRADRRGRSTSNLYRLMLEREGAVDGPLAAGDPQEGAAGDPQEGAAGDPLSTLNPQKEPSERTTGRASRTRQRDPLWDTFVEALGFTPSTKNGRGKWNAGIVQLRAAGATADTLQAAIKAYRKEWPTAEVSPTALATHWDRFQPKTPAVPPLETAVKMCRLYDDSAREAEIEAWVKRGVDEDALRAALTPPIEKLAAAPA